MRGKSALTVPPGTFTIPSSDSGLDDVIETLKETRAVSFFEGGWTARQISHIAEISHQVAIRKGIPNGFFGENASPGVYHPGVLFQAPRSKRNIRRYHDIVISDLLHNPVICCVKSSIDKNELKQLFLRNSHP